MLTSFENTLLRPVSDEIRSGTGERIKKYVDKPMIPFKNKAWGGVVVKALRY